MVSYAYSYSLGNQTGVYNNGTHEIILRYNLRQVAKALIDSPRNNITGTVMKAVTSAPKLSIVPKKLEAVSQ